MEPWQAAIGRAIQLLLVPTSTVVYTSRGSQMFLKFCIVHDWGTSWHVSVDAVMQFALHLYQVVLAAATITIRLAAVYFAVAFRISKLGSRSK